MNYLIPFLVFIGLVLFTFGMYGLYSILFNKIIFQSDFKNLPKKIVITDVGIYSLSFPSKFNISNIELNLRNKDFDINFEEFFLKFKFYRKKIKWTESYKFSINITGEYTLDFYNNNQVNYDFMITKTISNFKKIFYIILTVLGFNLIGFGILIINSPKFHSLILSNF